MHAIGKEEMEDERRGSQTASKAKQVKRTGNRGRE